MKYHCLSTAVILWMAVTVSAASGQALQYEKGICSAFPPEFVRFDGENSASNPDGRLALMAAASSSELVSARKAYWQSYASGQPDEQARRKYARLLSAKDMFYRLRHGRFPNENAHPLLRASGQLSRASTKQNFGDVDDGIHPYARHLFDKWVTSDVPTVKLVSAAQIRNFSNKSQAEYLKYAKYRDFAEFLFLSNDSPLYSRDPVTFLKAYGIATYEFGSEETAREALENMQQWLTNEQITAVSTKIRERLITGRVPTVGWWGKEEKLSWNYVLDQIKIMGVTPYAMVQERRRFAANWSRTLPSDLPDVDWTIRFQKFLEEDAAETDRLRRRIQNPKLAAIELKSERAAALTQLNHFWELTKPNGGMKPIVTHRNVDGWISAMIEQWAGYCSTGDAFHRHLAVFCKTKALEECRLMQTFETRLLNATVQSLQGDFGFINLSEPHQLDGEGGLGNVMPILSPPQLGQRAPASRRSARDWTRHKVRGTLVFHATSSVAIQLENGRTIRVLSKDDLSSDDLRFISGAQSLDSAPPAAEGRGRGGRSRSRAGRSGGRP